MGKTKTRGNGEGTFYYSESKKRWVGQKVYGVNSDGKLNRKTYYGKTKKECLAKFKKYEDEQKNGLITDSKKLTVHDIILMQIDDDYELNIIQGNAKRRRLDTLRIIDEYKLGSIKISELTEFHIKSFFKSITHYSNSSIGKIFNAVKRCCAYAKKKGFLTYNPFEDGSIIKPKSDKKDKKISALTVEEEQKLIDVLKKESCCKYKYQLLIMLCTGMRMGEINALTIKDICFDFNVINVNKTISRDENDKPIIGDQTKTDAGVRILDMTPTVKHLLKDYVDNHYKENKEQLLFYDSINKSYITTSQVNSYYKRLVIRHSIIPYKKEMVKLSEKGRKKIAYKKYTYYKKVGDEYIKLPKDAPSDWSKNFGNYYYEAIIAEKEYSQHMLRHTFATRCIENEVDYKTLSEILGHADITVTLNTYTDIIGKYKKQQFTKIENFQKQFNIANENYCNNYCNSKAV